MVADVSGEFTDTPSMSYDASTDERIVVDPATLLPYARDEQVYWYASVGERKGGSVLWSEHLVSRTRYEAH